MKEKELVLLRHLRENSRKSLTSISKETGIAVSTLFETLRQLNKKVIAKHVSMLDFAKLGYALKAHYEIHTKQKKEVTDFLKQNPLVNSVCLTIGPDLYAECIFKDIKTMLRFKQQLEQFETTEIDEIMIVDEIKKEEYII